MSDTFAPRLVSVIIPCFNHAKYVAEAINSVLQQTYEAIEIIVIDDGSTDNSADVIHSFGERVRLIEQENSGVSIARNRGMEEAQGEFIGFLDADDLYYPNAIERRVGLLTSHPEVGIVVGNLDFVDPSGELLAESRETGITEPTLISLERSFERNWGGTCGTVFRKELLSQTGPMDPTIKVGEDWDLQIRMTAASAMLFDPVSVAAARTIPGSLSRTKLSIFDDQKRVLLKNRKLLPDGRSFARVYRQARLNVFVGMHISRVFAEFPKSQWLPQILVPIWRRPSLVICLIQWLANAVRNRLSGKRRRLP